jgi:hypothetical protein
MFQFRTHENFSEDGNEERKILAVVALKRVWIKQKKNLCLKIYQNIHFGKVRRQHVLDKSWMFGSNLELNRLIRAKFDVFSQSS